MRYRRFAKLFLCIGAAAFMISASAFASFADVTLGSGSQSYRISVLSAIGTADSSYDSDEACTRAEFAKLMVMSSSYKDTADTVLSSAAANDVPSSFDGAQYIKTCLVNGWMRTRLGGNFAPFEGVSLNDAVRACMTALGYTDDDFGSNVTGERLSMFKSLGLNEGISAQNGSDTLTKRDAINIIYNLLRTNPKNSGSIYGTAVNLTLSSNNELNATNVIENKLVGPILVKNISGLQNAVPFDLDSATYYLNGKNAGAYSRMYIESQIEHNGWLIIYYNPENTTVWAYGSSFGSSNYYCVRGTVNSIYYDNDNIAAPSSVYIGSTEYELGSSDVKFMFSMSGQIGVGDNVVLICKETTDSMDNTSYTAVAVVKWDSAEDGSTIGTIFAEDATTYVVKNSSN